MSCVVSASRHDEQDQSHDRRFAYEVIVGPADEAKYDSTSESEADDEKHDGAEDACADGIEIHAAARGQAQRHGNDDPADRVINDGVARMICPRLRRAKFISRTTTATTFTEEMDRAVPRNSAVMRRY